MVGALPSMLYVLYLILSKDPFPLGRERERRGEERRERCYKHTGRTGDGDMVGHEHWRQSHSQALLETGLLPPIKDIVIGSSSWRVGT